MSAKIKILNFQEKMELKLMSIGSYESTSPVNGRRTVQFVENACYDVGQVAKILNRSENYVRNACRRGVIKSRRDGVGFLISGWQLRIFIEGSCDLKPQK